jgi:FtsP/CotA-like multicopper oxidase with cupredoxin domain
MSSMLRRRVFVRRSAVALAAELLGKTTSPATAARLTGRTVDVALEARMAKLELAGEPVELLTYNDRFPGPPIRAAEGDRLRVELTNALNEPTNLHFHGLHVPPGGNADSVFVQVPPGRRFRYELTVPAGFGGTFWYHPHVHGRLARQLWRGLAGPLVIDRPIDQALGLAAAEERIVVVKDIALAQGRPGGHTTGDWARGKTGSLILANGEPRPRLVAAVTPVRLRLINACNARTLRLVRDDGRPIVLIAHEGHLLEAPQSLEEIVVFPAQRVDLLLELEPGHELALLLRPYSSGARREPSHIETLLTLAGASSLRKAAMPQGLEQLERLDAGAATRRRSFKMAMAFMHPDGHPHHEPVRARLGETELWAIENVDTQDHVFHLHTWPFQIWRRDGMPPPYPAWRDTIGLGPGERVELLIPFRRHSGRSVFHCHIAEHGDAGMMGMVEVTPG